MSKFIYKGTLNEKYVAGTILSDNVEANKVSVNTLDSTREDINVLKNVSIDGDLSVSGDINIDDVDISTIKTNTITSDNSKIDFNKGISTTKYLSIGNNNYNITTDGGLCLGNFAASPYNDGVFKIGIGTGNNDRQTGLLFDNNGTLNVKNKIITNDLQSKNGNNIIKIYDNSIEISKDNGTNWTNFIKSGTGLNSIILNDGNNIASNNYSHAEGHNTIASGESSHAEGMAETTASAIGSHAEGGGTKAKTEYAHSEGVFTTAEGAGAHAEGFTLYNNRNNDNIKTWAYGRGAHAEGVETQAKEEAAHSEGYRTKATGFRAHAEGYDTVASGNQSHASGQGTYADQINMTAIGSFNTQNNTNALFVVGNGNNNNNRSDAFVVYKNGNILLNNNLFMSGSGHSQFLTYAQQDYANNDSSTRAISNEDFNYYILNNLININIPLKSGYKFVSAYRSRNELSTDFVDYYIINLDFSSIKSFLDNYYNANSSRFESCCNCVTILTNPEVSHCLRYDVSSASYANCYSNGISIILVSQGPASGDKSTDPFRYYIKNFDGFVAEQVLSCTISYKKLS